MRKPAKLWRKLLLFALFGGLLAIWFFLGLPCVPRYLTGIICPGCGMSRAWMACFRLEFAKAFSMHPMFWSVPVLALFILYDGQLFQNRKLNNWVLGLLLGGFAVCYLFRLIVFLGGNLTI